MTHGNGTPEVATVPGEVVAGAARGRGARPVEDDKMVMEASTSRVSPPSQHDHDTLLAGILAPTPSDSFGSGTTQSSPPLKNGMVQACPPTS